MRLNVVALSIIFNRKPLYVQTLHGRGDKQYNNKIEFFLKKFIYCNKLLKLVLLQKIMMILLHKYLVQKVMP